MFSGWVSYRRASGGNTTHGCALRVHKCTEGLTQDVSSRVPGRMTASLGWFPASPHSRVVHARHETAVNAPPLPRGRSCRTGAPAVISSDPLGTHMDMPKALPLRFWQSVQ